MSVTFWTIVSRSSVDATMAPTSPSFSVFARLFAGELLQAGAFRHIARDLRRADDLAARRSGSARPSAKCSAGCRPCAAEPFRSGRVFSPARILASTTSSSLCSSSGMSMRIDCPIASAAVYPNMRSAAGFHDVMMLVRSLVMMASSDDSTTAASRRLAIARLRAFADVASDLRRADDLPRIVVNRRDRQRNGDQRPVLPLTDRLEMGDGLTRPDPAEHHILFRLPVGRDDHANRLADRLCGCVAEHALGRTVPRRNRAVEILADDGVVRRFDDTGEMAKGEVVERWQHRMEGLADELTAGMRSAASERSQAF